MSVPDLDSFETDDIEVPEIITLAPGEEPALEEEVTEEEENDKIVLSKEEFEKLNSRTSDAQLLADGFKGLQEALKAPQQPVNLEQKIGESDEEFEKRLEKELFAEGKTGKTLKDAIARYGGGQLNELTAIISNQNKQILQLHPEKGVVFNRYKDEIESFVKALPPGQQYHPGVWEYAYEQIKTKHKGELESETINAAVDKAVRERLEALGIDPDNLEQPLAKAGVKTRKGSYVESGKGSPGAGVRRKTVYASAEDKANAEASGLPLEHYLRKIGKL